MPTPPDFPEPSQWWDSPPNGLGVVGERTQRLLACYDSEGRLSGPMTIFSEDDEPLIEANWKSGVLDGPMTVWRPPFFRTAAFKNGRPHGRWHLHWNEYPLVWVEFDEGRQLSAGRDNELSRQPQAEPMYFVNDVQVDSLEEALAKGDEAKTFAISGWMEATLPEGIWALENLEALQVFYSKVRPIPAEIGKLTKLKILEIKGCNVGSIDPAIGELEHLEVLKVVKSGLGIFPKVANPNLVSIDISGNVIVRINHSLADCPRLSSLVMRDSYLMTLDEHVFAAPALARIDMTGSFWLSWVSPTIGEMQSLVNLTLYEQSLLSLPEEIADCEKLQMLNLYGCHLVVPPWMMSERPNTQLNLEQTHVHALPGLSNFEEQLRERQAEQDSAVAAQLERDRLTVASLGLTPPDSIQPWETAAEAAFPNDDVAELATTLRSSEFGCEYGDYEVQTLAFGDDATIVDALCRLGSLRPATEAEFATLAQQNEGSELVKHLRALAPTEFWMLEVVPERPEDLKVAFAVIQFSDDLWAAVGPTLGKSVDAGDNPTEPFEGRVRALLRRDVDRFGGARLWYQQLDRVPGAASTIEFGASRRAAIGAYLTRSGSVSTGPIDGADLGSRDGLKPLADWLATLENPIQATSGAVAVYQHVWCGRQADKFVVVATRTVQT